MPDSNSTSTFESDSPEEHSPLDNSIEEPVGIESQSTSVEFTHHFQCTSGLMRQHLLNDPLSNQSNRREIKI